MEQNDKSAGLTGQPLTLTAPARFDPGPDVAELLEPTVVRLCLTTIAVSSIWLAWAMAKTHPEPNLVPLMPSLLLGIPAALSLKFLHHTTLSRLLLTCGLAFATLLSVVAGQIALAQPMALAATIVTGLLFGPTAAILGASALGIAAVLLPFGQPQTLVILRETALGGFLVWAAGGSIYQSLLQAQASETRAWQHAREAMQRRGELQQTTKMLKDMYALLERTNHELEIARREAEEAKEVKARFAANISHELRTPLNLILGFSRMMFRSPEVYGDVHWTPELRLDIHEIYRASRHLLGMIDDILDLSRIEAQRLPLKLEPTNLATLVSDAVATARGLLRDSPVVLTADVDEALPRVIVDRTRIRQVLLNLLNNAIRFTDSGSIRVSTRAVNGELEVAVTDTGVGISPEDMEGIFDEFGQGSSPSTSGRGGAGLGLAVCKQVVQLHGGRIWVESKVGQGSTFHFTIPVPASGTARSRLVYYSPEGWQPPLPDNPLGKTVVILAPDNASGRLVARNIEGYRAIILSSMDSLRDVVEKEHPAGVVLVRDPLADRDDTFSPEQVWDTIGRPDLGVVECELPIENLARRYLRLAGYVTKPVEPEQLLEVIRRAQARPERILIVDDDAGFRALLERVLLSAFPGCHCSAGGSATEALRLLAEQAFDLMLLDLVMPGESGIELLRQARESGLLGGAKVVVVTGAPYVEELAALFPARLHFSKRTVPSGKEWLSCIKALLDSAPADYSHPALAAKLPGSPQPQLAS